MYANDFIIETQRETSANWKNSDIPIEGEEMLMKIAEHFLACKDCALEFDLQGGFSGTLQDFAIEYRNTIYEDWCCS